MRVLYFSRDFTTHDLRFVRVLAGRGLDVRYLRLEDDGIPYVQEDLPAGVEWVSWEGGRARVRSPAELTALIPAYQAAVERVQPAVVLAGPVQSCGLLATLVGGPPTVVISWGSDILTAPERNAWSRWATRRALTRADGFVCDSGAVLARARTYGAPTAERAAVFPWGLERAKLESDVTAGRNECRAQLGWSDAVILIATRAWHPDYGIADVVEAFAAAAERDDRLRLILAGTGPEKVRVDQRIAELGIGAKIYRPGMLPETELHRLQGGADLYVCATPSDGTSISLLEAMWHSLPVVVVDNLGNREWVRHDQEGLLFPAGDVSALTHDILTLVAEPGLARAMGARGRAAVLARADWEQNILRLVDLLHRVGAPTRREKETLV